MLLRIKIAIIVYTKFTNIRALGPVIVSPSKVNSAKSVRLAVAFRYRVSYSCRLIGRECRHWHS